MAATLTFEPMTLKMGSLGTVSCLPAFLGNLTMQNQVEFNLDEWDEIYEAYGRCSSSYPYREVNTYDRQLKEASVRTAVLENENLKAVFLPDFGGRLWSLRDKNAGRDLIYTNDVLRYSNLAVRNAWFSGGVEWNIGIIGHTPMSTEPLHTAELKTENLSPILRMYGYERIRGLEYQMDFWLDEDIPFLNCRMRVVNSSKEVVPMYWWSNIAVPEYDSGRIVIPASEAYTCGYLDGNNQVYKTQVPMVGGIDVSRYQDIPYQVDYFFNIPRENPKFIANLDADGYGLLHMSTGRLQARKLFSWGHNDGSDRWQEFLTENAGRYVEIQSGLAKTQYGCIPLAPHTAWEWMEQYGPIKVAPEIQDGPFEALRDSMTVLVKETMEKTRLEALLVRTRDMAKTKASVVSLGNGYGALKNYTRAIEQDRPLSLHLDYGCLEGAQKEWADFLDTGVFMKPTAMDVPEDFQCDDIFYQKLKETIQSEDNKDNWYAHYQLGAMHLYHKDYEAAGAEFEVSLDLEKSPWAYHGLSILALMQENKEKVRALMPLGIQMLSGDPAYVKEGFRILIMAGSYSEVYEIYQSLSKDLQADSRITYYYLMVLSDKGEVKEAFDRLTSDGGFVLNDLREGEDSLSDLYTALYGKLYGKLPDHIPHQFNFHALEPAPQAKAYSQIPRRTTAGYPL